MEIPNPPWFAANFPVPGTAQSFPLFVISIHPGRGEKSLHARHRRREHTAVYHSLYYAHLAAIPVIALMRDRTNAKRLVEKGGKERKEERRKK